ncbi:hypothetical protein pb186bvf_008607 [Paramecium bursaria]
MQLHLPTSILFSEICNLYRHNLITDLEKRVLKKLVINEYQPIYDLLDSENLKEGLLKLRNEIDLKETNDEPQYFPENEASHNNDLQDAMDYIEKNPDIPEELASPLGVQLFRRRIEQNKRNKK